MPTCEQPADLVGGTAPPDRQQAKSRPLRLARSLHRADRTPTTRRSTRSRPPTSSARREQARRSRTRRDARRAAGAAARPAARGEGSGGHRRPADHLRLAAVPRQCAGAGQRAGGPAARAPAPSSRPRPTCPRWAPAPTRATSSGAPPAIRSIRISMRAGRRAARPPRWRRTSCPSAPARTRAVRCAFRPPSAAWWASGPRRGWCPVRASCWAGRRSRWSARWAARWQMPACNWRPRPGCR